MSDSGDESFPHRPGYITPPLSPSKTVSTEGWFSPRTPSSPRKTRSCHFGRGFDHDTDTSLFTPPASPTKSVSASGLGALISPETTFAPDKSRPPQSNYASPVKRYTPVNKSRSSSAYSSQYVHPNSLLTPDVEELSREECIINTAADFEATTRGDLLQVARRLSHQTISHSRATKSVAVVSLVTYDIDTITANTDDGVSTSAQSELDGESNLSTRLRRFPLRSASSPLRPSQWVARGGLLRSARKGPSSAPDRYIGSRRPLAVTRESFKLNKPAERLDSNQPGRRGCHVSDPFSRRLRRSGRLNDELRGLREAHSLIIGRASAHRRVSNLVHRRVSSTLGARQVSTGAVWNVGGPSAVSDTVIGVSTGRGGMLGSGTNAPLYASTFLNRADPEAELEAYERRLALAMDVDQADRILQHSPALARFHDTKSGGVVTHMKHTWRDSAWIKDGLATCLYSVATSRTLSYADSFFQATHRSRKNMRRPVPILPFRYVSGTRCQVKLTISYSTGCASATG
jgi:hypothetical protein